MRISIGADHAGESIKTSIKSLLEKALGHEVVDEGTHGSASVDYPDFAERVARKVSEGAADRGVLICGTGIGMSIVANKFPGVRAALVTDVFTAKMSRAHNDANILCIGSRVVSPESVEEIVKTWFAEPFEGGRHQGRLDKIRALDPCAGPEGLGGKT